MRTEEDTICVMFYTDKRYEKLAEVAKNSFLTFNSKIPIFVYTSEQTEKIYNISKHIPAGIRKYMVALAQAKKTNSKKVIILGCDTITCSRLDEFLDNNEDILCTLDYPYQLITSRIQSPDSESHVNADVVCFNNLDALYETIKCSLKHKIYYEQGGLNEVLWSNKYDFTYKIVDAPFSTSNVVYNARSKGNLIASAGSKPWAKYTNLFHIQDKKLFTGLHKNNEKIDKQIKVWHYCDGLGTLSVDSFEQTINWWIEVGFNRETKNFFKDVCNAGDFFHQVFRV